MTEQEKYLMIDAWVEKNKPKRYKHGERPPGETVPTISSWGRKRMSAAEKQAALDCGEE